ncbi:MAG: DNA internalization-related competence protein ComEC/Rec2 [Betaproteobacteria bacterium]
MRSLVGIALIGFACGVAWLQVRETLPAHPALIAALGAVGLVLVFTARARMRRPVAMVIALTAAATAGFGYAAWRAESRLAEALPQAWEGEDIEIVGVIDDLPSLSVQGTRFAFSVERVRTPRATVPSRLSLAWFAPARPSIADEEMPVIHAGERWYLTVRLKRPHGTVNPGGFDLEAWLLQQGLRATGYVHPEGFNARSDIFVGRPGDYVQRARERIRQRIVTALSEARYAGVIVALAIGDQRAIPEAQWVIFNRTGISHLVSISGLHVTVFAAFAGGIAYALARRSVRLTARVPARKIAAVIGVLAAGGYVMLAGAEVPAVRTFAMLAVAAFGLWWGRPGTAGIVWLWALVGVLLWDPWATLTPGFWLSFGAVGLLLYASVGRLRPVLTTGWRARTDSAIREGLHAQWVVTLGLTPLTLALFQQVSLIAPVANAVAIPVVTLGVVPLALLGIAVPLDLLFQVAHAVLAMLMRLLEVLSALPDATWQQHAPMPWTVAAGIAGTFLLVAPRGMPGRAWGFLWLLPLLLVRPEPPPPGAFRLTVLDVGQGLSAVIETHHYTLVYDAGPRFNETSDAGGRMVAPFLRAAGLRRADGLIISHADLDHSGGALSLMQATPIGWFASSLPAEHPIVVRAQARGVAMACLAGQQWEWDDVRFTVLHPTRAEYDDVRAKTNDRSCVVRIDSAYGSALLTGDLEAKSESLLLRTNPGALPADVLVVPHHGSRTSSTPAFIAAVAPKFAIFACGYRNRFGHPRPDIVRRYEAASVRMVRTDLGGAVTLSFAPDRPLAPILARDQRQRYWMDAPEALRKDEPVAPAE